MTMPLPRSCTCGQVHFPGQRCPQAREREYARRPSKVERFGHGWDSKSKRVIARDGGMCQLRLAGCTGRATTADHVVPRSRGGTSDMGNLVAACRHCNSVKGSR